MKNKIDKIDYQILTLLSANAQMPYTEVAKEIGISPGTVHKRTKKMKDLGVIKGATLKLDYSVIGWKMTIFLGIYLRESILYLEVVDFLMLIPEVVKVHQITGKYDIFLKMHAHDSIHYRQVYQEHILAIEGIRGIESFISVEENISRHIRFGS